MTINQPLNTRYQYLPTDDRRAAVLAALRMLKESLMPDLVDVPSDQRRKYSRGGPRALAFKRQALVLVQAAPDVAPKAVNIDRFARDVVAADDLRQVLQDLEHLVYAVEGSVMVLDKQGYDDAAGVYQGAETGAKLGQPAAKMVHDKLALHMARVRRPAPDAAKAPTPGATPPAAASEREAPESGDLVPPPFEE